jgi:hypothetical protein
MWVQLIICCTERNPGVLRVQSPGSSDCNGGLMLVVREITKFMGSSKRA